MNRGLYKAIFFTVGALLIVGTASMPFGFYQLLRWAVTVGGAAMIVQATRSKKSGWGIVGGLAILLWCPVFGVSFDKTTWMFFDLAFAAGFITAALRTKGE